MKVKDKQRFLQRSRIEIIACLLAYSSKGSRKTRLIYGCNLSVSQFNKYSAYLIEGELLEKRIDGNSDVYYTTEKGIEFLKDYEGIKKLLDKIRL